MSRKRQRPEGPLLALRLRALTLPARMLRGAGRGREPFATGADNVR